MDPPKREKKRHVIIVWDIDGRIPPKDMRKASFNLTVDIRKRAGGCVVYSEIAAGIKNMPSSIYLSSTEKYIAFLLNGW